jgi:preprotein translocase subunit SecB
VSEIKAQLDPVFTILGQGIRDLSFENKIEVEQTSDVQPEIDIDIQADGRKIKDDVYEVVLMIRAEAKQDSKTLFILELQYMGICQIQNIPSESLPALLMIQVPTLLFPYARQIVSELTSNAGFPPLLLQPVDFAALYQRQNSNNAVAAGNA